MQDNQDRILASAFKSLKPCSLFAHLNLFAHLRFYPLR